MYFEQENHTHSKESLKGLSLYACPCGGVFVVCALGHACALPDGALRFRKEPSRKGAGVALGQMLPHCTRFLQWGLTQSAPGKCLLRVPHEQEEAPEVGAAAERMCSQEAVN